MPSFATIAIGWLLSISLLVNALPHISRSGKYLYNPDGERFYIKGVAYQPQGELATHSDANADNGGFPEPSSFIDPLSDPANCTRDIPYLEQLGVNAIRVYSVNASLNHDECMQALDDAGIYVMLDISLPLNGSIDRASPSWSTNLLNEYITTIDAFRGYPNILAYNIGNEVINLVSNTHAAPYVKAAARDIKAYLRGVNSETLVGYAAVDGEPEFRDTLADYLTCGEESIVVDLYGLNNYEWCGDSNYNASGWASIVAGFSEIPVASYMSEYGCIFSPPRLWTEVEALFSEPVTDVFSGGIAFSYFPTNDGYGMVTFSGDGSSVETTSDFDRLSAEYNSTNGPNSPSQSSQSQVTTECPAVNGSLLASTDLPPTPDESVCNCINQNAFACRVRPQTANEPIIVGALTDYACNLLGQSNSGATCAPIGGNGTTGVYGDLSYCSPEIKLSYVFSAYYEFNPIDSSCDFDGNATLSSSRPNTADDAASAASSCIAQEPSGGVFTPSVTGGGGSAPTSSSPSGSGSAGSSSTTPNAAMKLGWDVKAFGTIAAAVGGVVIGAVAIM